METGVGNALYVGVDTRLLKATISSVLNTSNMDITEFPLSIMDFDKEVYVNIDEYEEEEKEEAKNEQEPKPNVVLKVDNVVINLNKKKGGD